MSARPHSYLQIPTGSMHCLITERADRIDVRLMNHAYAVEGDVERVRVWLASLWARYADDPRPIGLHRCKESARLRADWLVARIGDDLMIHPGEPDGEMH